MKIPKMKIKAPSIKINKELTFKIINILSVVIAICAIALSVMLYNKRKMLFDANNQMATAINLTSKQLDKGSGTNISKTVTVQAAKLSYQNPAPLSILQKQASSIIGQRNTLSNTLGKVSTETPGAENLNASNFSNIKSYTASTNTLLKATVDCGKLLDMLPKKIIELAGSFHSELKNETKLQKKPTSADYTEAFKELINDAAKFYNEYEDNKKDLISAKEKIKQQEIQLNKYVDLDADYKRMLKAKENQNLELSKKTSDLVKELNYYKNQIKKLTNKQKKPTTKGNIDYNELLQKIHGEVLKFDEKWGNAIVNIGKDFKVKTKVDGKEKIVSVSIPVGSELIVARNDKFIARIKVQQVYDTYSLTSLSFPVNAELKPGDIVFFPSDSQYNVNNETQKNDSGESSQQTETDSNVTGE